MPQERFNRALRAMKPLGLSSNAVTSTLKRLLKLYDNEWELIEAESYRVLADAVFEHEDELEKRRETRKQQTRQTPGPTEIEREAEFENVPPLTRARSHALAIAVPQKRAETSAPRLEPPTAREQQTQVQVNPLPAGGFKRPKVESVEAEGPVFKGSAPPQQSDGRDKRIVCQPCLPSTSGLKKPKIEPSLNLPETAACAVSIYTPVIEEKEYEDRGIPCQPSALKKPKLALAVACASVDTVPLAVMDVLPIAAVNILSSPVDAVNACSSPCEKDGFERTCESREFQDCSMQYSSSLGAIAEAYMEMDKDDDSTFQLSLAEPETSLTVLESNNNLSGLCDVPPCLDYNNGLKGSDHGQPCPEYNNGLQGQSCEKPCLEYNNGLKGQSREKPCLEYNNGLQGLSRGKPCLEYNNVLQGLSREKPCLEYNNGLQEKPCLEYYNGLQGLSREQPCLEYSNGLQGLGHAQPCLEYSNGLQGLGHAQSCLEYSNGLQGLGNAQPCHKYDSGLQGVSHARPHVDYKSGLKESSIPQPSLEMILKRAEDYTLRSFKILFPNFPIMKMMEEFCLHFLKSRNSGIYGEAEAQTVSTVSNLLTSNDRGKVRRSSRISQKTQVPPMLDKGKVNSEIKAHVSKSKMLISLEPSQSDVEESRPMHDLGDISRGEESIQLPVVNEVTSESSPPPFHYIPRSIVYQNAYVNFSLARIGDDDCCSNCFGDCLESPITCACARETGGEYAYTRDGILKNDFLREALSLHLNPQKHQLFYCKDCPLERTKNDYEPDPCKGHVIRRFIKECWSKCGCNKRCGNRVVQRGISRKLQVFFTPEGKGWGVRTLEEIPEGAFVCEYVGEILTNTELYNRNNERTGKEKHTYPVLLDADWCSEGVLKDEEALCLDATHYGNVARFINHRCFDANLMEFPVEVESPDRHYYHLAFFTTRKVEAHEELTWDYGIDFDDCHHPIKAFQCRCGSRYCRDAKKLASCKNFHP